MIRVNVSSCSLKVLQGKELGVSSFFGPIFLPKHYCQSFPKMLSSVCCVYSCGPSCVTYLFQYLFILMYLLVYFALFDSFVYYILFDSFVCWLSIHSLYLFKICRCAGISLLIVSDITGADEFFARSKILSNRRTTTDKKEMRTITLPSIWPRFHSAKTVEISRKNH